VRRLAPFGLLALGLLGACNALFGIEEGELAEPTSSVSGVGGASSTSGSGGGSTSVSSGAGGSLACGDGPTTVTGDLAWAHGSSGAEYARAMVVAFGQQDDIVVAGTYYADTISFGGQSLPIPANDDIYVASFERDTGKIRWLRGIHGAGWVTLSELTVGGDGTIALTGAFDGAITWGNDTFTQLGGQQDAFLALYDGDGAPKRFTHLGNSEDTVGAGVAFDADENLFVSVAGSGAVDFGDGPVGTPGTPSIRLAKLDPSGAVLWTKVFDTSYYAGYLGALATNEEGNVALAAATNDSLFGSYDSLGGGMDLAVTVLKPNGDTLWGRVFAGTGGTPATDGDQWANAVAFTCDGDVVVTGAFQEAIVFDDEPPFVAEDPSRQGELYVLRLGGGSGETVWANYYTDAGLQYGNAIGADLANNIVLSGLAYDDPASEGLDLGGGILPASQSDGGTWREDLVLLKLDGEGNHLFSKRFKNQPTGELIQMGEAAVSPSGPIAVAGDFFIQIDLDPSLEGQLHHPARDMFVALFDP
jgi:hypothetical protein